MTSAVSWARVVVPAKTMKIPDLEIGTATAVMPACLVRQTRIWVWSFRREKGERMAQRKWMIAVLAGVALGGADDA